MSGKKPSRNAPCPCGSCKKYKHCCYDEDAKNAQDAGTAGQQSQYPVGTVAMYGPDDKTTTKIAAGVIFREGGKPTIERWVAADIMTNAKIQAELKQFFLEYGVTRVVMSQGNMGCPHEEGEDFPLGEDCPFLSVLERQAGEQSKEVILQ